jgi:site-specific DNA recombinase
VDEYYGYIRVSTTRQGIQGVSLQEQKQAVERYAQSKDFTLIKIFEDQITAAKSGRPAFSAMLKGLKTGRAKGVIIHKIDRGARNLRDWADLGELIDSGVEVHFANESLDLASRGGRLSADIQAVVAADFIRNLREETKKGFYGRLKQGLFPMPAPLGYLNAGKGNVKAIDLTKAPLVRTAFELYATGKYGLKSLNRELYVLGLRSKSDKRLSLNALSLLINNPFYMGVMRIKKNGQSFEGKHEALISPELFEKCQDILHGRTNTKTKKHNLIFRRLLTCETCKYHLIGEVHGPAVYYRCQTKTCPMTTLREEFVEQAFKEKLEQLTLTEDESRFFEECLLEFKSKWAQERLNSIALLEAKLTELGTRLNKLTDAFLDASIEKEIYDERKQTLIVERKSLQGKIAELKSGRSIPEELQKFLEFTKTAKTLYEAAFPDKKRRLVQTLTSKTWANKKSLVFGFQSPFNIIADRQKIQYGRPSSDVHRGTQALWLKLVEMFRSFAWPEI